MNKPLHKLLCEIFAGQISFGKFPCGEEFGERNGLGGKWDGLVFTSGHATGTPWLTVELRNIQQLYWTPPDPSSAQKQQSV